MLKLDLVFTGLQIFFFQKQRTVWVHDVQIKLGNPWERNLKELQSEKTQPEAILGSGDDVNSKWMSFYPMQLFSG